MKWWLPGFCFLLLIYAPGIPEPFFIIDDQLLIQAPQIQHFSLAALKSIFTLGNNVDFYPLRDLSYVLDWSWGGDLAANSTSVRLQNFFWFFASVLLIFGILRRIGY